MIIVALWTFIISGVLALYRLIIGPSVADRIVALDVVLMSLMGAVVVDGVRRDDTTYFVLLVVLAIVGFTATVAASRYLERQPDLAEGEF